MPHVIAKSFLNKSICITEKFSNVCPPHLKCPGIGTFLPYHEGRASARRVNDYVSNFSISTNLYSCFREADLHGELLPGRKRSVCS